MEIKFAFWFSQKLVSSFLMHGYLDHDQEQPIGCCWLFTFAKVLILFGIAKFFLSFLMNNPKELDFRNRTFAWYWRKGRFKQIHEWYNHQGFDAVDGDDFIHISEYLIQSTYG